MFFGTYNHTLDEKGRLIIPAKLRDELGSSFFVATGKDSCLYAYPQKDYEELLESYKSSIRDGNAEARNFVREMASSATIVEIDKQGRIVIPPELRELVGLEKDIVLLGVVEHVEIWDKERRQAIKLSQKEFEELSEKMSNSGK